MINKIFLCVFISVSAFAFKLSPMVEEIPLKEKNNRTQFYVENEETQNKIAVQIKVYTREMDLQGVEKQVPTTDFSVYPEQLILSPKEKRGIKITYNGKTNLDTEQAYRVVAEQLPVEKLNSQKKSAGISILLKYVAALYLVPNNSKDKIEIESITNLAKENKLKIIIQNNGTKHRVLRNIKIDLKSKKETLLIEDAKLEGLIGENILAKSKREFIIKNQIGNFELDLLEQKNISFKD